MDLDTAVAMISPSTDIRNPMGAFTGGKAYREWISEHFRAFPDAPRDPRHHGQSDRTLAFEWRATGTFAAPLLMPGGEFRTARRSIFQEPNSGGLKAVRL